jgi:ATP-dependent exoDNAse (exonuclease V) alpha subunit
VAIYHLKITSVGRSAGRRATAAAAYRAGDRLHDERSGRTYNFSGRTDVLHAEILLPAHLAGAADAWAGRRERLWNTAEHAEKRSNSRVAREYEIALPHELDTAQQIALARGFSREIAERYRVAVDLAVHAPRAGSDPRNYHAHLLTTTREVTPAGLGAKAGLDLDPRERRRRELPDSRREFLTLRERWAALTNEALREAGLHVRVDHRSLAAQGIDRVPVPHIPIAALKMEQRGVPSRVAEIIRQRYRGRVQKHLERAAERQSPEPREELSSRIESTPAEGRGPGPTPGNLEQIRRQAREAWLQLRSTQAEHAAAGQRDVRRQLQVGQERELDAGKERRDDDLAL